MIADTLVITPKMLLRRYMIRRYAIDADKTRYAYYAILAMMPLLLLRRH